MKNTILKPLLSLIILVSFSASYGQTKQETEKWILDKLRLYGSDTYKSKYYDLNGHTFIYSFEKNDINFRYQIPVWAIKYVSLGPGNSFLVFNLKKYCKECKFEKRWQKKSYRYKEVPYYEYEYGWGQNGQTKEKVRKTKRVQIDNGYETKSITDNEFTGFEVHLKTDDPEQDFIGRFNKAIQHLQSLYPKQPITKETF